MNKVIGGGDDDRAADLARIQTLAEYAFADRDERDSGRRNLSKSSTEQPHWKLRKLRPEPGESRRYAARSAEVPIEVGRIRNGACQSRSPATRGGFAQVYRDAEMGAGSSCALYRLVLVSAGPGGLTARTTLRSGQSNTRDSA